MNILTFCKSALYISISSFFSLSINAQNPQKNIQQDPRFEQLLNEKRKINNNIPLYDYFKIQIFTGENEEAKKTLIEFRKNNKNLDGTIVFHTPIYKVWVGNFKTRIEAEKKLSDLKKKYPNAFLIKPNKQ
ncbi:MULTISPECIES: SPOR domain-containing protein [Flavobacterium]|uniref:SPOR domain-containing protein n=2 Tax=Flavobacterium TaxID=237 RepID=A0AA94JPU5_9FLAO|nr:MULTISPECIES: SPOR domain-containing protein [Flavobacterium]OXA76584.1 SPOR domain-containing protein [Flavobacterium columnare NBRC 100251 = ATCC 23463]AMA48254.1 sporulation protein [Flavobacterium covae]MCH4830172.1 SPOR domain-containing protein [Flavobacterium columnare]MCH4832446.1 SPOR domain-containing protein [Flavobacterium columnare]MCJ1806174.1 SPOR domain-containing protein [Flavobacterium covae]